MKKYLLYALAGVLLSACGKEETIGPDGPQTPGGEIRFEIGIASPQGATDADPQTRVATDDQFKCTWEAGDAIGIFAFKEGTDVTSKEYYIKNAKLTFDGEKWQSETPLYWPNDGKKLRFYACYPYNAMSGVETFAFSVRADQSADTDGRSNLDQSDLLLAQTAFYDHTSSVPLVFSHYTGMIQVTLDDVLGVIDPNEKLTVTLRGAARKANIDFKSSGWTALQGTDKGDITMRRVEQPDDADYYTRYTFRAIVPLQMLNDRRIFRIANGKLLLDGSPTASDFGVAAGEAHLFTQKLPYTALPLIKAGTFLMGSPDSDPYANSDEKPQRNVTIPGDFYMGRFEVTRTQYAQFLNAAGVAKAGIGDSAEHTVEGYGKQPLFFVDEWGWTPRWNDAAGRWEAEGSYPMFYVTWYGAKAFADWVGARLPSEEEWEYACRAGTTTIWSFGDNVNQLGDYAVFFQQAPARVGTKRPNPWGLYDMHGNIVEWTTTDNWGGASKVVRGGACYSTFHYCRSAYRRVDNTNRSINDLGFRLVFDKK